LIKETAVLKHNYSKYFVWNLQEQRIYFWKGAVHAHSIGCKKKTSKQQKS
jgi:hypothetical protein